jgi:two-component SAPR family response regulator
MGHKFKIILISAEENYQNNHSNIFDEIYMKPISKNNLIQI